MNDQETPPQDPKRSTQEFATPPLQALTKPDETQPDAIPEDETAMPADITLQTLAAQVIMNKVEFDAFKEVVTARFATLLTPQQITQMMHDSIKQASEEFDNAVARIEKIGNEISSNFAGHQMVVARLDVLQPQVVQMIAAYDARVLELKKQTEQIGYMSRALSLMMGQDITQPDSMRFGKSIIQIVEEAEDKTETAIEKAQHAQLDVAEARRDFVAMTNQATGLKALLEKTLKESEANRAIISELKADKERWQQFRELGFKVLKSKWATGIMLGAFGGLSSIAVFGQQFADFLHALLPGLFN